MGNGTGKPQSSSGKSSDSGSRSSSSKKKKSKSGRLGPAAGAAKSTLGKNPNGTPARASRTPGPNSPESKEKEASTAEQPSSSPTATSRVASTPRVSSTARTAVASPRTAQATPREASSVQATPRTVRTPHGQSSSNLNQQQQQQQQQVQFHQQQASLGYHDPAGGGGNGDPNHLEPLSEYGYYDREYEDEPDDYGQALSMRQAAEPELHPAFANPAFTSEDHYPLVAPTGAYLQEEPGYPADRGPMSWPPTTENLDPLASWPPAMTYAACIPATPYRVSAGGLPQSPLPAAAGVEPAAYDPFAGLPSGSGTFGNPSYPLTHFQAAANAQVYVNPTSVVWGKQVIPPPEYLRELEQQNIILWSTQKQLSKILQDEESQKWLKLLQVSLMTVLKLNPVQQLTVRPKDAAFTEEDVWRETAHFQSGESAVTAKEYLHNIERQNRLLWETQALVSSIFTNPDTEKWAKKGQAAITTVLNLNRIEKLVMKSRTPEQVREDERKELENANPFAKPGAAWGAAGRFPKSTYDTSVYPPLSSSGPEGQSSHHHDGHSGRALAASGDGSFDSEEKSYDVGGRGRSPVPPQMVNAVPARRSSVFKPLNQSTNPRKSIDSSSTAASRRHAREASSGGHRSFLDAHAIVAQSNSQTVDEEDELRSLKIGDRRDEEQLEHIVRDAVLQATPRGRADTPEQDPLPSRPTDEDGDSPEHSPPRMAAFKPLTGNPNSAHQNTDDAVRVHDDEASQRRGSGTAAGGLDADQLYVYLDDDHPSSNATDPFSGKSKPRMDRPDAMQRGAVTPVQTGGQVEALPGARQRRSIGTNLRSPNRLAQGGGGEEDDDAPEQDENNLSSPKKLISPGPAKRKPTASGMSAATQAMILRQLSMKAGRQK